MSEELEPISGAGFDTRQTRREPLPEAACLGRQRLASGSLDKSDAALLIEHLAALERLYRPNIRAGDTELEEWLTWP